jgi:hypothetical protein
VPKPGSDASQLDPVVAAGGPQVSGEMVGSEVRITSEILATRKEGPPRAETGAG